MISTTGAPVGQPPPPPAAGQTIKGVITDIRLAQQASDQSRIVIESGNVAYTITINVDTAWEINIASGAAQTPPSGQMFLNIREPDPGATVGNPFTVRGRTAARSQVVATVTFFLGFPVGSQTMTANSEGQFTMRVPVTLIGPNTPHNLTVNGDAQRPRSGTAIVHDHDKVKQFRVIKQDRSTGIAETRSPCSLFL